VHDELAKKPRLHFRHSRFVLFFVTSVVALSGCRTAPSEPKQIVNVTRPVGSWSGRGTATVGDIPSETGRFHIVWETTNESPRGSGTFKLTMRSAISGRPLQLVADHKGVGTGTAEYDEGPRTYDFLVESSNVDWSFRVEETSGAYGNSSPPSGAVPGPPSVPGKR
jgi:hypothetical protein